MEETDSCTSLAYANVSRYQPLNKKAVLSSFYEEPGLSYMKADSTTRIAVDGSNFPYRIYFTKEIQLLYSKSSLTKIWICTEWKECITLSMLIILQVIEN